MVNGQWSVVNGQWSVVNAQRSMVNGERSMVNGQWSMVSGRWSMLNTHDPIPTTTYLANPIFSKHLFHFLEQIAFEAFFEFGGGNVAHQFAFEGQRNAPCFFRHYYHGCVGGLAHA